MREFGNRISGHSVQRHLPKASEISEEEHGASLRKYQPSILE
jgi:hypothetical protein